MKMTESEKLIAKLSFTLGAVAGFLEKLNGPNPNFTEVQIQETLDLVYKTVNDIQARDEACHDPA